MSKLKIGQEVTYLPLNWPAVVVGATPYTDAADKSAMVTIKFPNGDGRSFHVSCQDQFVRTGPPVQKGLIASIIDRLKTLRGGKVVSTVTIMLLFASTLLSQGISITIPEQSFVPGDHVVAPVSVSGFQNIGSYQFALIYGDAIRFDSLEIASPQPIPFSQYSFGLQDTAIGIFRNAWIPWVPPFEYSVPDGTVLYTLHFTAETDGALSQDLMFGTNFLPEEAYLSSFDQIPITLSFIGAVVSVDMNNKDTGPGVKPNPCNGFTTIYFTTKNGGNARVVIGDATGKPVQRRVVAYNPGTTAIDIVLETPGLYFGCLYTDEFIMPLRIISKR